MMQVEKKFHRHHKTQHSCKLDSFVYFFFIARHMFQFYRRLYRAPSREINTLVHESNILW